VTEGSYFATDSEMVDFATLTHCACEDVCLSVCLSVGRWKTHA